MADKLKFKACVRMAILLVLVSMLVSPLEVFAKAGTVSLSPKKRWFTAHRGIASLAPENTVPSFKKAVKLPVKAVEMDCWEVKNFDGSKREFVIMHDETLDAMCGSSKKVTTLTKETIGRYPVTEGENRVPGVDYHIPVIEEYLEIMQDTNKVARIEVKSPKLSYAGAKKLVKLIREYDLSGRATVASLYRPTLMAVRKALKGRKDIKLAYMIGMRNKHRVDKEITWGIKHKVDSIDFNHTHITRKRVKRIRKKGIIIEVWPVDTKSRARWLLRAGVNRIMTNVVLWR